ncbi:transcriptional regulator [soil metagenome]
MQRLISQIGRSQRLAVINALKHSPELTVQELADRMNMSYMGVRQHCLDLAKDGYLDTRRQHNGVGRPQLLYFLSKKAQDLFPQADNALAVSLLEQARKLFGVSAAEKILFLHFQEKTKDYASRIKGDTLVERLKWLTRLRDKEGHVATLETDPALKITERHHPSWALFQAFPEAASMERDMLQKVLGVSVRREAKIDENSYECSFFFS